MVSNVRLFCLLFMLDWTSAIWSDKNEPVTETGIWYRGMASPYSYDYYLYLKDTFNRKSDEEIWQSKRRILYHVRFEGKDEELSEGAKGAASKVCNFVKSVGSNIGVDFSLASVHNLPDDGLFKEIDHEIINHVYVIDPLLGAELDEDMDLLKYSKRHRKVYNFK